MSPVLRATQYVAGREVRHGARIPIAVKIAATISAVCDSTEPERWHGEVKLADTVVLRTDPTDSFERGGREAEVALKKRIVQIFSDARFTHAGPASDSPAPVTR